MSSLYFDNAATSYPKPLCVYKAVNEALIKCTGNPGRSIHREASASAKAVFETRERVAGYFNSKDVGNVFFALNATAALNTAILGIHCSGGALLISDVEHNAVLRPAVIKCKRDNLVLKQFKTFEDQEKTFCSFKSALTGDVKCVAVNAASNVDGRILPIAEIGNVCMQKGVPLVLDVSQLAGHKRIDISKIPCTAMCCAGHKGLYSPMGCGFGILGDIEAEISPLYFGGNGVNSKDIFVGDELPEKYESGTIAVPNIFGLYSGIKYLEALGDTVNIAESRITEYIVSKLKEINEIEVHHAEYGVPVISIVPNKMLCDDLAFQLSKLGIAVRSGFHCAPLAHNAIGTYETGTVRISPSAFNSLDDCNYLIESIKLFVCRA